MTAWREGFSILTSHRYKTWAFPCIANTTATTARPLLYKLQIVEDSRVDTDYAARAKVECRMAGETT
jgi:hypothetical protein